MYGRYPKLDLPPPDHLWEVPLIALALGGMISVLATGLCFVAAVFGVQTWTFLGRVAFVSFTSALLFALFIGAVCYLVYYVGRFAGWLFKIDIWGEK